ncbi:MAG: 3-deoxy-7-phosphoheptulonate synthase [Kiritimatiellae bacterium]|nr:3-deoxy-7-phosphoheptulonate synthase [Kiritimatiellia bacterium]
MSALFDENISSFECLPSPNEIKKEIPIAPKQQAFIQNSRATIKGILDGRDMRLLAVVGPCAIHDIESATEYAIRLNELAKELEDNLVIIMRVYFEKPRGNGWWKGLINDPFLDDSFRIEQGIRVARKFLAHLAKMGLPAATEALDPVIPQYLGDLISWTFIGQRASESNAHRTLASGLSTPVGFKNSQGPNGLDNAIKGIKTALRPNAFLGINDSGVLSICRTRGNDYSHIVLRGDGGPNYGSLSISKTEEALTKAGLPSRIMVDCSHGNSEENPAKQAYVLGDIMTQIENGNYSIVGFMLESYLGWGSQELKHDKDKLQFGVSVTDPCIDWETTEQLLRDAAARFGALK